MATVQSSTEFTRQVNGLEARIERGDFALEGRFDPLLSRFESNVAPWVEPQVEVLSSSLIQLAFPEFPGSVYRISLQGSGIDPVGSVDALGTAIENGFATGSLNSLTLTHNATSILSLALAPGGYTLTSGSDVLRVTGTLPATLTQIAQFAEGLGQLSVEALVAMTPMERNTYFADLAAFGITGVAVETGGNSLATLSLTPTMARLQLPDLEITLNGQLPTDFGAFARVLYDIYTQFEQTGRELDLTELAGLGVDSLVVTGAGGAELLRLTGQLSTEDSITQHTVTGTAGSDVTALDDLPFIDGPDLVVNLLAGNDTAELNLYDIYQRAVLPGVLAADLPRITLDGGAGIDLLAVENYANGAGVVINLDTGRLEGFNLFSATPNSPVYSLSIAGFENVALMGAGQNVLGNAANNIVQIADNFWQSTGDFLFAGAGGTDTLDLSGTYRSGEGWPIFTGIDRATLDAQYDIALDGNGGLAFTVAQSTAGLPQFRLLDVEFLAVKTATGSDSIEVASLIDTNFQAMGGAPFYGSYLGDRITGTAAMDEIHGMDGTDTLIGGDGDDFLFGGSSTSDLRDVIYGGDGADSMDGGHGNDELHGGNGNDTVLGGFGSDTVIGNAGDDLLAGGAGSDQMFGGPGNDTLNGGFGYDRLNGGTGADRFYHLGVADHASDWIQDYDAAGGDVLVFGQANATRAQFQINVANTPNAGAADVSEAFVIYRPTGQIMWALVDGDAQTSINLQIGGQVFDLLA